MPRTRTGSASTISDRDFQKLLKLVSVGNHGPRNKTILLMTHFLALRAKEIAAIKISDVVDGNGQVKDVLRLQATYTKGMKHRDVPLSNPKVRKAIQEWINYRKETDGVAFHENSPLFRSQKGVAFSPNSMCRMINNLYKDNGFSDCSSHTGRRTMITKLANAGIDLSSIRLLAGHSSIQTTQRYIQENPDKLAQIMKRL